MPEILEISKDTLEYINSYINQRYFLYVIGSIFLLGIVGQWVTKAVYGRLIRKAENMVSTKNKMLKQIRMKFENCKAVNGVVANPSIMVERYIKKYKFLGITLGGLSRITNMCALICLIIGAATGFVVYQFETGRITFIPYILTGVLTAFALDLYSRSSGAKEKEGELVCIITDFLENTLNCKARRQERTAETLKMMENEQENGMTNPDEAANAAYSGEGGKMADVGKMGKRVDSGLAWEKAGNKDKIVAFNKEEISPEDKFKENYEPDILHKELDDDAWGAEEKDIDALRKQEYIISEVLGEFL